MAEQLPRLLGPYELLERIGTGRVATTYLARERSAVSEREGAAGLVSLKLLYSFANVTEQRAALARESALQSQCTHGGVVPVLEPPSEPPLGADRCRCIVRSYVSGFTVGELLDASAHRGFPLEVVAALGDSLIETLSAVHDTGGDDGRTLGLFHRDVTPSNVLVSLEGEVWLTDFGLAHAPGAFGLLSDEEVAQGTPRYVTPEAARGEQPDGRSDLFQTALVLIEALGCSVRDSVSSLEVIREEELQSGLPELLGDRASAFLPVLREALDADPRRRFATAADMLAAWRGATMEAPELAVIAEALSGQGLADVRRELTRSWLHSTFADLVRSERERVARALRR